MELRGPCGRAREPASFQLYRANLAATTRTGTDRVATVKERILPKLLGDQSPASHLTFVFGGRVMRDDALFYADHFMMLPV